MITKVRTGFNWGYIIGLWVGLGNAWVAMLHGVQLKYVALVFGIGTLILALLEALRCKLSKKEELERLSGRFE